MQVGDLVKLRDQQHRLWDYQYGSASWLVLGVKEGRMVQVMNSASGRVMWSLSWYYEVISESR